MKLLVAVVSTVALLGTACVIHTPYARSRSASSASAVKKCPPGHQWSDGRCHNRGRGHDRSR